LFANFLGGAALFEMEDEPGQPQAVTRVLFGVAAIAAWGATVFYAFQHPTSPATVKRLTATLVVLFVTRMTFWDFLIDWFDLFLLVAFAAWLGAEGSRLRGEKRARLSLKNNEATEKPWKKSAWAVRRS